MAITAFVTSDLMATFFCPECGKYKQKDVSKFIGHKAQVKLNYKCGCQRSSSVILERRRSFRKKVNLKGYIIDNSKKHASKIKNLSKQGIKIEILDEILLKKKKNLKIGFILNDPKQTKVLTTVCVRKINSPVDIGCEFLSYDYQRALDKYYAFYC